jgi:hypothetical protein
LIVIGLMLIMFGKRTEALMRDAERKGVTRLGNLIDIKRSRCLVAS